MNALTTSKPTSLLDTLKAARNKYSRNQDTVKIKEGKTRIRILPPLNYPANMQFWQDRGLHWIKEDPNGKVLTTVGSAEYVYSDANDPVAEAIAKAKRSAIDDDAVKLYKSWDYRKTVLVQALVRSGADASEENPVVLELASSVFNNILAIFESSETEGGGSIEPDTGIDIFIERSGKGLDTQYVVMPAMKSAKVSKTALENRIDLAEFVKRSDFTEDRVTKAVAIINKIANINSPSTMIPSSVVARGNVLTNRANIVKSNPPETLEDLDGDLDALIEADSESDAPFDLDDDFMKELSEVKSGKRK